MSQFPDPGPASIKYPFLFQGVSSQPPHVRFSSQVEDSENATYSVAEGVSKRPSSRFIERLRNLGIGGDYRLEAITRDESEQYLIVYGQGELRVFELLENADGDTLDDVLEATVTLNANTETYLYAGGETFAVASPSTDFAAAETGVSWGESAKTLTKTGAFTGYTFQQGDEVQVTGGTDTTTGWYEIASKDSDDQVTLVSDITTTSSDQTDISIDGIRSYLQWDASAKTLTLIGAFADYSWKRGDQIDITGGTGVTAGYYNIESKDSDDQITLSSSIASSDTQDVTDDEIRRWPGSSTIRLTTVKDFTFIVNTNVATSGDNSAGTIDKTTMPIEMVRTSYTGDGSTPATFEVDEITWTSRGTGTSTNNPLPSIINDGRAIADVTSHRNRLVLAGDENVVMSQAGDFFNLFIDDPSNLVDSDPIDVALTSNEVTLIDYVVPFRRTLIIFTKAGQQFEINTPEILSPTSIAISPSTRYLTLPGIRPETMGSLIYFLAQRKDAAVLYEYVYDDRRITNFGIDVTSHVFGLLPSDLRSMAASPNNETIIITPADCDTLYIYQTFHGLEQKEQSAWGRWVFDSSYRISGIAVIRNDVYLLIDDGTQWTIEAIAIARQVI